MPAAPVHECEVLGSPWEGVYATRIRSARHYGRHSHGTFGFGVVRQGAHRSRSGRGTVDAFAGEIVTTNPGEVHDGRPLRTPVRTCCTVYVDPQVLATIDASARETAITHPVLVDAQLRRFAAQVGCTPHAWLLQQRCERVRSLARQGLPLAEAAAAAGFADQSHMTRLFTRQFGFTPGAWQRAQRAPQ